MRILKLGRYQVKDSLQARWHPLCHLTLRTDREGMTAGSTATSCCTGFLCAELSSRASAKLRLCTVTGDMLRQNPDSVEPYCIGQAAHILQRVTTLLHPYHVAQVAHSSLEVWVCFCSTIRRQRRWRGVQLTQCKSKSICLEDCRLRTGRGALPGC